ncbi:ABC transporter ATP-binding protein [Spiroplasma chinense]|uniref:ABC transporter ATP-binding protein n=1 Tax=Spiroplasma chinense TaxID=216932 RepID=A0A5B9Y434_9MOLU|nr:ATP-binding cassette domain-containing protein [Spiroplasma chinense]QEH61720.1 ABC transporter ATP-binding protein [Spiroplasma chinense]
MIEVKNLSLSYKKREVLNVKELIINDKDKIALAGLNGAGKTTLAEILIGVKGYYKGELNYKKDYIYNAVFQDCNFVADCKIKDIFYLYCDLYNIKMDHKKIFEEYDLLKVENNLYKRLSGGQQQKFKFLIALLNEPNFLLLDEITTALDYDWRVRIIEIIKQKIQNNDMNLLLISHNPEEIAHLCNRIVLLQDGSVFKDEKITGTYEEKIKQIKEVFGHNV